MVKGKFGKISKVSKYYENDCRFKRKRMGTTFIKTTFAMIVFKALV